MVRILFDKRVTKPEVKHIMGCPKGEDSDDKWEMMEMKGVASLLLEFDRLGQVTAATVDGKVYRRSDEEQAAPGR